MIILALDSSTQYLTLALSYPDHTGKIISAQSQQLVANNLSLLIIPAIEQLLKSHDLNIKQIAYLAVNIGPGSFTGIRVGVGVILGISYAINCKVIELNSFALIAQSYYQDKILIALDARLGEVYLAGMQRAEYLISPQLIRPTAIKLIPTINDYQLMGDGFINYNDILADKLCSLTLLKFNQSELANNMLNLASKNIANAKEPHLVEIMYLRNNVALNLEQQSQLRKVK